jgi:hypothetical protein
LNSLFIVGFAPAFFQNGGKVNTISGPMKFGLGLAYWD